jgi:hypothetical protein
MIALVASLGLALPSYTAEESLADKAARARRTAAPASAPANPPKVYTNEDLLTATGTVIVAAEPEGEPGAVPDAGVTGRPATPEPSEEEKRAQAGAALQKQIDEQAEIIRLSRKAIEDSERELGDLTNYTFGTRRAALMQSVEDARQAMAAAERAIADLEDQARHQGIRVSVP